MIVADTVATFPLSAGSRRLDADYCVRLGRSVVRLLGDAILAGQHRLARGRHQRACRDLVTERELTPEQMFMFVHIAMNTAIDELSHDPRVGAETEPWPQAAQIIRRAAFDLLAAWTTRSMDMPERSSIEDALTTLHTRPVLDAVLLKECHRAERFEHWVSMMLIDIDNLSEINRAHGYGVGDRILERMGILLRTYFREHDWVVRYADDTIAVLLPETTPADVLTLAERTRAMVEDRLTFRDYRTDQRAVVTVSVAATSARALEGEPIDHERFLTEAEATLHRAKAAGRNCVEHVFLLPRLISIEDAVAQLGTTLEGIEIPGVRGQAGPGEGGSPRPARTRRGRCARAGLIQRRLALTRRFLTKVPHEGSSRRFLTKVLHEGSVVDRNAPNDYTPIDLDRSHAWPSKNSTCSSSRPSCWRRCTATASASASSRCRVACFASPWAPSTPRCSGSSGPGSSRASWSVSDNNRRARYYTLTAAGRRRLSTGQKAWERTVAAMMRVLHAEAE